MIDAHFHVWRQADLPWLAGPVQPRIFGPYAPIRRDCPMTEYLSDIAGTGITRAVHVQANRAPAQANRAPAQADWAPAQADWAPAQAEAKARFIEETAQETGWPHATLAYADMTVADARPHWTALQGSRACGASASSSIGTTPRSTALRPARTCAPTPPSSPMSRGWPTMAGRSICRCSPARCALPSGWSIPVRR